MEILNINSLSIRILYSIIDHLSYHDIISLIESNKNLSNLCCFNNYWENRIKKEANIDINVLKMILLVDRFNMGLYKFLLTCQTPHNFLKCAKISIKLGNGPLLYHTLSLHDKTRSDKIELLIYSLDVHPRLFGPLLNSFGVPIKDILYKVHDNFTSILYITTEKRYELSEYDINYLLLNTSNFDVVLYLLNICRWKNFKIYKDVYLRKTISNPQVIDIIKNSTFKYINFPESNIKLEI